MAQKTSPNLYSLLEVEKTATQAQIKTSYKKLALKWHPDKHPESERDAATEKFKEISGAYSVLSNEQKRAYYDKYGRIEGSDEDMQETEAFMEDLMRQFFGGGMNTGFDDFDEFVDILEGGNDKAFRKMFRDLGRNARVSGGR